MIKRKNLIDKKFQLKTTFRIIGIIIITFILIIAVTGIISIDNTGKIKNSIFGIKKAIEKEDKVIISLLKKAETSLDYKLSPYQADIIKNHSKSMKRIYANISLLKKITYQTRVLFLSMVIIGILLAIILYFYIIKLTNRISGPIHVISSYIEDVINGKKPELRGLRKDDELKEFYDQFVKMLDEIK